MFHQNCDVKVHQSTEKPFNFNTWDLDQLSGTHFLEGSAGFSSAFLFFPFAFFFTLRLPAVLEELAFPCKGMVQAAYPYTTTVLTAAIMSVNTCVGLIQYASWSLSASRTSAKNSTTQNENCFSTL